MPRKRTPATQPVGQEQPATAQNPQEQTQEQSTFRAQPAARMRAADYVFETLSRAILMGELAPGSVLATQRALSQQFGVSPLVVRQATHRLEELGLVRVRQGSTTVVLDPNEATDLRLARLQLELATPGDRLSLAAREMQSLFTLPLLVLAERRLQEEDFEALEALIEAMPDQPTPREQLSFRRQFWGLISRASHNSVFEHHFRWWARVMREMAANNPSTVEATGVTLAPRNTYRGLLRALRRRRGAIEYWMKVIEPLFDWAEAQPNHPIHSARPTTTKRARAAT